MQVIRIWFQHARERKKKSQPHLAPTRGRGRGRGRGRAVLVRSPVEQRDMIFDHDDDSDLIVANRTRIRNEPDMQDFSSNSLSEFLTEFQKVFLENYYLDSTRLPGPEDLDYLTQHINASREAIHRWFQARHDSEDFEDFDRPASNPMSSPPPFSNTGKRTANPFIIWMGEERRRLGGGEVKELSLRWRSMGEEERWEEGERARRSREQREEEGTASAPAPGYKDYHCPTCGVGFSTKGNMWKHIRTYHEREGSSSPSKRQGMEEEPVTFESFRKYFDSEAVGQDPQDLYPQPAGPGGGRGHSKTKFSEHQRGQLLAGFHR